MARLGMERTLWIALASIAVLLAAAFFLYLPVLPILVTAGLALVLLCSAGLALAEGWLEPWVEIEEGDGPDPRDVQATTTSRKRLSPVMR